MNYQNNYLFNQYLLNQYIFHDIEKDKNHTIGKHLYYYGENNYRTVELPPVITTELTEEEIKRYWFYLRSTQ